MQVFAYRPGHPALKDCIDCFYILRQSPGEMCRYKSFPSIFTNLSYLRSATFTYSEQQVCIEENKTTSIQSIIRKNLFQPCNVEYKGSIDELTIFFTPLGIQHFPELNTKVSVTDRFIQFVPELSEAELLRNIFEENDFQLRIHMMENHLAELKKPFDHPFLKKALEIMDREPSINNESLALTLKISRKTLHHHFEQYLGVSPSKFRKISRFRKSIQEKQSGNEGRNLTDLAYTMDFFDQSHMIRDIRSLTGFVPKDFFKHLKRMQDSSISWIIE